MCVTFLKPTFFYYMKFLLFHSSLSFRHQPVKSSAKQCKSEMIKGCGLGWEVLKYHLQLCYRHLVGLAVQVIFPYSEPSTLRQWATALCNEYSLLQMIVMRALFCNFGIFWSSKLFSYYFNLLRWLLVLIVLTSGLYSTGAWLRFHKYEIMFLSTIFTERVSLIWGFKSLECFFIMRWLNLVQLHFFLGRKAGSKFCT